jgi:membrane fusion protein, heavy metal efflux system
MNKEMIFLSMTLFLLSCGGNETKPNQEQAETIQTHADLSVANFTSSRSQITIEVNGKTIANPQSMEVVSTALSGIVRNLHWNVGDHVAAGQVIGSIESTELIELQRQYLNAKSEVMFLEADAARLEKLAAEKAASERNLQETQMKLGARKADLKAYEKNLELIGISPQKIQAQNITSSIEVRSKIQGEVREVFVENGQFVQGNNQWLSIATTQQAQFELLVPSYQKALIQPGAHVRIISLGGENTEMQAEVRTIANIANSDNLFTVICSPSDGAAIPAIGIAVSAEIDVQSAEGFLVPSDAIVQWENGSFLFIPRGTYTYELMPIQVLHARTDSTVIEHTATFNAENFVHRNAYTLLMALKNTEEE